jgi:hypothetical protein
MQSLARILTGFLLLDGNLLPEQRVLLISKDMTRLLASTTTMDDGTFNVSVPAPYRDNEVILLVKIQGPIIALAHRVIDLKSNAAGPHEVSIDTTEGNFYHIHGDFITTSRWPPYLMLFVDPVHIDGIPAQLEKFFYQRDEQVDEATFFRMRIEDRSFHLKVQCGTYRIGGDYLNYFRPMMVKPDFENYVVTRLEADGESQPLEGNRYSGYLVEVKRDRSITMKIEVIPDEELSPSNP